VPYSPSPNPSHQGRGVFVQSLIKQKLKVSGHGVKANGKGKIKEDFRMNHFSLDISTNWLYRMMGKRSFYDEKGIPKSDKTASTPQE